MTAKFNQDIKPSWEELFAAEAKNGKAIGAVSAYLAGQKQHDRYANMKPSVNSTDVNSYQISGNHYKVVKYQPWDVVLDWELGYLDGTALKYISRWKKKNGLEDIRKAIHFLEKLLEVEEAKNGVL